LSASSILGRLKALRPASGEPTTTSEARGRAPEIPEGAERLVRLLEANIHANEFGEYVALRKWYAEPVTDAPGLGAPEGELDPAALQLLAPNASREIADQERLRRLLLAVTRPPRCHAGESLVSCQKWRTSMCPAGIRRPTSTSKLP